MIRFYVFSNDRAKKSIEEAGFRVVCLESPEKLLSGVIAVNARSARELERIRPLVNELSRSNEVLLFLSSPAKKKSDDIVSSPQGVYLTTKETEFISHVLNDDVVKKTCSEMGISRSGYYKMLEKILGRLSLESAGQLKSWALVHLSV